MRKTTPYLILLLLVFSVQTAFSQDLPIKLGLQVSPNISWMSPKSKNYESDGTTTGVTIGLISDFYFTERYSISTGINFSFLNGKIKFPNRMDSINGETWRKYNIIYLEIPMMIKMETKQFGKFSLYGQIGFGTGFRLTATEKDTFVADSTGKVTASKDDATGSTALIRESVIIGFGTEYHLDESSRILVGVSYSNALNNVLSGVNPKTAVNEKSLLNLVELKIGFIF